MKIKVREGTISEVYQCSLSIPEFDNPYQITEYEDRLQLSRVILIAEINGEVIGFKVGYDRFQDGKTYYSWMGGVIPAFRKRHVASDLLSAMEGLCRSRGYSFLKFKTLNSHKSMQIFAIKNGFEIEKFKPVKPSHQSKIYYVKAV